MTLTKIRKQRLQSKIQEARSELIASRPFFGILLMYLKYVAVDNIRNISTNGRCIYFHPDFLDKLTAYELQYILCHQIMHILSGDIWRDIGKAGDEYHRALDVIDNRQLIKMGWKVDWLMHLGKLQYDIPHCPYKIDELVADEIYKLFPFKLRMLDERTRNRYMADTDFWWDYKEDAGEDGIIILDLPNITMWANQPEIEEDGNGAGQGNGTGKADKAEEDNLGVGDGEQMKEFWETKAKQASETAKMQNKGKGAGSVPDSVKRQIEEKKKPILDWRKMLDDFVQEETTDYSFSPPDRRFSDFDFFLPDFNEKEFIPKDILFMADTSGSVDQEELEVVYSELRGAIEQFNGKINGKLGFFDAAVTPPIPFENVNELERIIPYGGGGTDFTVIFEYIKNNMSHCLPSAIVIFTDGYGPFPEESDALGIPVMWLIDNEDVDPPFGKVARILTDRFQRAV